ncbi:hypothetical protein WA026_003025 [Henosepilachna vigintioctopunctata]|uniref:Apolipoprotein D n=1 Tax=Henosepilachna vigintioctopunctata TaxID=420089 RepID=A0AAW1TM00_9CUCU
MYAYLIFVALLANGVQTQVPFSGKCPRIKHVQQNFDVKKFEGVWISTEKYFAGFEIGKKCFEAVYSMRDNETMFIHNRMIGKLTRKVTYMDGYATPTGEPGEGKFLFLFKFPLPLNGPYWVLETDYDSYAVMWSCSQAIGFNSRLAWILTRARNFTQETLDKAYSVLDKNRLSKRLLRKMDQTGCPKYDENIEDFKVLLRNAKSVDLLE